MNTRKKRPAPAPADRHKGYQLPARVSPHMRDVLEAVARKERRKLAQMVVLLLEEALRARGDWSEPPET